MFGRKDPKSISAKRAVLEPVPCINCGGTVVAKFCTDCGQSRHDHSRSLRSYLAILFEHHLMLDSKTVRTLFALLFRPGFLTNAYIDGHRMRYGAPVRTYILVSFAFFVALYLSGFALIQFHVDVDELKAGVKEPATIEILKPPHGASTLPDFNGKTDLTGKGAEYLNRAIEGTKLVLQHPRMLNAALDEWLPRLLFLLLPFAAILLIVFSRRRGLYFVDHLAFALHLQSFVFALATLAILVRLINVDQPVGWPILGFIALYMLLAYRRVYRSSWFGTVFKTCMIGGFYSVALVIGFAVVLSISLLSIPG